MIKEKVVALVLGVLLGSVLGVWVVSFSRKIRLDEKKFTVLKKKNVEKKIKKELLRPGFFEVSSPKDNTLVSTKIIKIKGRAPANSLLIAQSPLTEKVILSKKEEFELEFPVAMGENVIHLTLYNKNIQSGVLEKKFRVYLLENEK